jgi:nicotinate-nucleotide pyrophosphorylase (carboxylating)
LDVIALPATELQRLARAAVAEDLGTGDLTSDGMFGADVRCQATLLLKEPGVLAGLPAAEAVFAAVSPETRLEPRASDGDRIEDVPAPVADVEGPVRAVLAGERVALNLLGRLSGIATLTRRYVDAVEGTNAVVLDTRKTTPGLRALERYAVRCGGGTNHRLGLWDAVLVKDNHLRLAGGIRPAVERLRATDPDLPIELEVESLAEVREALDAGVDRLLFDNMPVPLLRDAVALVAGRVPTEASGGVSLETVRAIAETGVDFVSVGALTHAARSLDVSMEVLS